MALTSEEFGWRVKAAAALHGMGMRKLRDALDEFGADRTLAEAMIRGDVQRNVRNIRDLAETLGVPEEWFTVEDWRVLIAPAAATPREVDLAAQARERAARALAQGQPRSQRTPRARDQNAEGG